MSIPGNSVLQMVRTHVEIVLDALVQHDWQGAATALRDAQPIIGKTSIGTALRTLIDDEMPAAQLAHGLYVTGTGRDDEAISAAYQFVADTVPVTAPLLIVRHDALFGLPRYEESFEAIGVISLAPATADRATLVHEMTHAFTSSGHRMIDEGLAELLAIRATSPDADTARLGLTERGKQGPAAAILAARRWSEEPCFESLHAPAGAAHAVAALVVADFIDSNGMNALISAMRDVRNDEIRDVRALFGLAVPTPSKAVPLSAALDSAALRRKFRMGDIDGGATMLAIARPLHLTQPDEPGAETDYLLALLLAADVPQAEDLRAEFDRALERYLSTREDTPLAYALCVSREGLNIRYAPNFIALSDSFQRGRAIIEAALDAYPDDIDVVATAAKFELYTPLEYGGSPALARSYVQRAAALTDDDHLAAYLRDALVRFSTVREAA